MLDAGNKDETNRSIKPMLMSFRDKVLGSQTFATREKVDLVAKNLAQVELIKGNRLLPMLHVQNTVMEELSLPYKECLCGCYGHILKDCTQKNKSTTVEPEVQASPITAASAVAAATVTNEKGKEINGVSKISGEIIEEIMTKTDNLAINGDSDFLHGDWIKVERKKRINRVNMHGPGGVMKGSNFQNLKNRINGLNAENVDLLHGNRNNGNNSFNASIKVGKNNQKRSRGDSGPSKIDLKNGKHNHTTMSSGVLKGKSKATTINMTQKFDYIEEKGPGVKACAKLDIPQSSSDITLNSKETRCSDNVARAAIKKLGLKNYIVSEAHGFLGGIWLLWNRQDIEFEVIQNNFHFIHVKVKEKDVDSWLLTVVYASPRDNERDTTRHQLMGLAANIQVPWLMMGDFNEIARTKFTWRGPKWNMHDKVFKKLDRVLCNVEWRLKYHEGFAKVLPRVQSDHHLIMVLCEGEPFNGGNRPFRFEAAWITHEDFHRLLCEKWERGSDLLNVISSFTPQLKEWNLETFGNIFKRKKELLARINGIQNSHNYGYSNFLENLEKQLQEQLAITLYQEECLWFQKSRSKWIVDGDRNTKYYHTKTIIRRRKNKILSLRDESGVWVNDPDILKNLVRNFYTELFKEDTPIRDSIVSWTTYPNVVEDHHGILSANVQLNECKSVLFDMGPHKAPGEDGYPAIFFQQCWDTIAEASIEQAHCVMHCLDILCQASGQNTTRKTVYTHGHFSHYPRLFLGYIMFIHGIPTARIRGILLRW
ncbi:hypothetical protein TSUD_390790 [Trifolium subterraneum]|uniref:Uncharacterized protein n=1 Tax=Trifolium subterraneum TaxID=3900 RepID=A0A2Z6MLE9_TRISU|nr:hypothetical protein TSUD_390790 [Trifolium subterraneum]